MKEAVVTGRKNDKEGQGWRMLALLAVLLGFASISTDIYLPAMPTMARALHAANGHIEWTVSGYLAGFSLGQLLWGPAGDRYGRKRPIALGLVLFAIGAAGCAVADSVWMVIACRVIQALGAAAGVALGRAMVRDLYSGERAAQMMSWLMTVMGIAPLLGPLLGGQILLAAGWRAIFWTLVAIGLGTLLWLTASPETLPLRRRRRDALTGAFSGYVALLANRRLLAHIGTGFAYYAGMFAYVAGTPAAYIGYHHVAPQRFGWLFALGILGIMTGNMLNARWVARWGTDRLLNGGGMLAAGAGIASLLVARADVGGLWGLVLPLVLFASATGLIVANAVSGALEEHAARAGAVSALIGCTQYGGGMVGSWTVGMLADGTPVPLGATLAACGLATWAFARLIARGHRA